MLFDSIDTDFGEIEELEDNESNDSASRIQEFINEAGEDVDIDLLFLMVEDDEDVEALARHMLEKTVAYSSASSPRDKALLLYLAEALIAHICDTPELSTDMSPTLRFYSYAYQGPAHTRKIFEAIHMGGSPDESARNDSRRRFAPRHGQKRAPWVAPSSRKIIDPSNDYALGRYVAFAGLAGLDNVLYFSDLEVRSRTLLPAEVAKEVEGVIEIPIEDASLLFS